MKILTKLSICNISYKEKNGYSTAEEVTGIWRLHNVAAIVVDEDVVLTFHNLNEE
ncbi:hypothetical protein ACVRXS_00015 [Streptococcus orisratti]|uniref:hypothetical protein n=1 Tax=Streptococcus orisratti TaxID=114652 RepID=UPI000371BFFA|nr:hypothetical protein [Streptococcus orisratti]